MNLFLNCRFPAVTTTSTLPLYNASSLHSFSTNTTFDTYEGVINPEVRLMNFASSFVLSPSKHELFTLRPFDFAQGERVGSDDQFASLGLGVGISGSARVLIGGPNPWRAGEAVSEADLAGIHDQNRGQTLKVVNLLDPSLKTKSSTVTLDDLASANTQRLIDDLMVIVSGRGNIGISAPQVGQSKRIAVIGYNEEITVLVNPELEFPDDQKFSIEEECLSVHDVSSNVQRHSKVLVHALDRNGEPFKFYTEGKFAALIQHEVEHLDGKLFTDLI